MSKFGFDFEDFDTSDEWNDFDEMFYQMTMKGPDEDIEDEFDPTSEVSDSEFWDKELNKDWL